VNYELVTFEGFTPHRVPVIVECLTENRNRTSSEIRVLFNKGSLGVSGSVSYLFGRYGMVVASHPDSRQDPEEAAIEAGAQEVEKTDEGYQFLCEMADLATVGKQLQAMGWQISASEFVYVPKSAVEVPADARKEIDEFLSGLDDNDDVHRIFTALK
jgi:transcriptional/translational regulatory protein YebC/TACO1